MLKEIFINTIITTNSVSLPFSKPNRPVIIGSDLVLISGLATLHSHVGAKIKALVVDVTLTENKFMVALCHKLLISERIAIGLRLEQLLQEQITITNKHNTNIGYQAIDTFAADVAKIIGFNKYKYIRAKKIYLSKNKELINAVDDQTRSINKAVKLLNKATFNYNNLKKEQL